MAIKTWQLQYWLGQKPVSIYTLHPALYKGSLICCIFYWAYCILSSLILRFTTCNICWIIDAIIFKIYNEVDMTASLTIFTLFSFQISYVCSTGIRNSFIKFWLKACLWITISFGSSLGVLSNNMNHSYNNFLQQIKDSIIRRLIH